eukprot:TRINITY_DN92465_c0_g1_i1.p1 TRINITY_DN92465_c0_g1~~TRINITY_DN92465_c0_g1_i1.p1  ORF type:complete len:308 (+),score=38.82 TRINITY_DN92465_c0_g1_i1:25-948(+)
MDYPLSPISGNRSVGTCLVPDLEDPYEDITSAPENVLERLADAMQCRAKSAIQHGIRQKVLHNALKCVGSSSSGNIVVADVGCGTGIVTHAVASMPSVAKIFGYDPSPYFLERARETTPEQCAGKVEFHEASSTSLPLADGVADLVIFMHVFTHIPRKDHLESLQEARRILKPGGHVLLKDNDLAGWSLTQGPTDMLSAPVETLLSAWSSNKYLCRQWPVLLTEAGFVPDKLKMYCTVDDSEESYGFQYVLMRSINVYERSGRCTPAMANLLRQEAKRRVESKEFQCVLTYGVCIAYKPRGSNGYNC